MCKTDAKKLKVTFISNYLNHHQLPFSLAMRNRLGNGYCFVATTPTPQERLNIGYHDMNKQYPFVITTYDSSSNIIVAKQLALESDLVIIGSAPNEYIMERLKYNRITFQYSERIYKEGYAPLSNPIHLGGMFLHYSRHHFKQYYLLCSSAYTAADFAKTGAFLGKTYKWGYFPEVKSQCIDNLISQKQSKKRPSLLWVGRFLSLKHPDDAILLADRLLKKGYEFDMNLIGGGEMEQDLYSMIEENALTDYVHIRGSMPPENVRDYMENSDVFLFTSDYNEGWGAVLNEAMNSGCSVVASHAIGSVGFLLKNGINGLIYENGNLEDLFEKTEQLLQDPNMRKEMGIQAYYTMINTWNADTAADRILKLYISLKNRRQTPFKEGPCSKAKIMSNRRLIKSL